MLGWLNLLAFIIPNISCLYPNFSFATEPLESYLHNSDSELNSKVELVASIFKGIDFPGTMA